mgnify:CR=1 FL=1
MTRWTHLFDTPFPLHSPRCLVALALLASGAFSVQAQSIGQKPHVQSPVATAQLSVHSRKFPEKAGFGLLRVTQPPDVLLDGKAARLAPGARIYGTDNLLQLSGTLVGKTIAVAYVKDSYGLLYQVWILTDAERKAASGTST